MSADNYHYVGRAQGGRIGLWLNLSASDERSAQNISAPDKTFDNVTDAVMQAHREHWTEYGVTVDPRILEKA